MAAHLSFFLLLVIVFILSPHPAFLVSPNDPVHCSQCSHRVSGREFPQCLHREHTCQKGQVCSIIYKPDVPMSSFLTIGCTTSCIQFPRTPSDRCIHGGQMTSFNTCVRCCQQKNCTDRFRQSVFHQVPTTTTRLPQQSPGINLYQALYCPVGECDPRNLNACQRNWKICQNTEYCNMAFNMATGNLTSSCSYRTLLSQCKTYSKEHHCPFSLDEAQKITHLQGYCYYGCCEDNACVQSIVYSNPITHLPPITSPTTSTPTSTTSTTTTTTTTTAPTTKPTTTTIPIPTTTPTTSYDYSALLTSCADKLIGSTCPTLRDLKGICKAAIGATLCPMTCNICQVVKSIVCEDKAPAHDCTSLIPTPGFCQDDMSIYICAKSCNLCSKLVKSVVDEVLNDSPTPDFNHLLTTPPTLHCPELLQSQCQHVRDVCNHSNLHDICPRECKICS